MKILNVVGARPEFIQVSPLLRAIDGYNRKKQLRRIESLLIHTGQHYDYNMSKIFFDELALKDPDYHLEVGSGTHGYQTGEIIKRLESVLIRERPDLVVVYGDTNSTLASALAAAKIHIKVAHIEAGVRSFNRYMPEETNRVLTDQIADLHFCPSKTAVNNLEREGIRGGVYFVGDVMYDSILHNLKEAEKREICEKLKVEPGKYAVATVHRAENTDDVMRLKGIFTALGLIAQEIMPVITPLHPRTRKVLADSNIEMGSVQVIESVSYLNMINLEKNSGIILTDSGGMQKEAFYLKVPCVTLRNETEWIETVELGWNILAGAIPQNIMVAAREATNVKRRSHQVYGDGHSADKILSTILKRT